MMNLFTHIINLTPARLRAEPSDRQKASYSKPGHNIYFISKSTGSFFISFQLPVYNL